MNADQPGCAAGEDEKESLEFEVKEKLITLSSQDGKIDPPRGTAQPEH